MNAEQVTTLLVGAMLLLSHYINYRATTAVRKELHEVSTALSKDSR